MKNILGGSLPWLFLSYKGRARRLPFFLGYVALLVSYFFAWKLFGPRNPEMGVSFSRFLIFIPFAYSSFALSVKRLHDCGRSGLFCLLYFLPFMNLVLFLYLLFKGSVSGGTPPPEESTSPKDSYRRWIDAA